MTCSPLRIIGFTHHYRRSVIAHAAQPSPSKRIGNLRRELESKSGCQSEGVVETVDDLVTFATSDKLDRLFKGMQKGQEDQQKGREDQRKGMEELRNKLNFLVMGFFALAASQLSSNEILSTFFKSLFK